jgi:uncharacterized membrane protein
LDDQNSAAINAAELASSVTPLPTPLLQDRYNTAATAGFSGAIGVTTADQQQTLPAIQPTLPAATVKLSHREEAVLLLILEKGMLGPSDLAKPLDISAPTATRDLQKLEHLGMVETAQFKKRVLSNAGLAYAQQLLSSPPAP